MTMKEFSKFKSNKLLSQGVCMVQSAEHPTFELGPGHDLMVREIEPRVGLCVDSTEAAWNSLPLPLCSSPAHAFSLLSLSLKIINIKKNLLSLEVFSFFSKVEEKWYKNNKIIAALLKLFLF